MSLPAPLPLSLFAAGPPALATTAAWERVSLDPTCWVDLAREWLHGGDDLLAELVSSLPWRQGRRLMWGEWLDEPRLSTSVSLTDRGQPAILVTMARALGRHYGRRFDTCFCNYYRDGQDSVAWHADRDGRVQRDPYVAIVSLGGPRQFALRPKGGGPARAFTLHSGDLLVMGGAMQHQWEHAVPKQHTAPPRLSVTFRHRAPAPPIG
jgi:alkylated DNA repair dioxygenase AlkB